VVQYVLFRSKDTKYSGVVNSSKSSKKADYLSSINLKSSSQAVIMSSNQSKPVDWWIAMYPKNCRKKAALIILLATSKTINLFSTRTENKLNLSMSWLVSLRFQLGMEDTLLMIKFGVKLIHKRKSTYTRRSIETDLSSSMKQTSVDFLRKFSSFNLITAITKTGSVKSLTMVAQPLLASPLLAMTTSLSGSLLRVLFPKQ